MKKDVTILGGNFDIKQPTTQTYTVAYHANGGTGSMIAQTTNVGADTTALLRWEQTHLILLLGSLMHNLIPQILPMGRLQTRQSKSGSLLRRRLSMTCRQM